MDEHKRTIVKSITWRIIATTTTVVTVYVYTGDLTLAAISGAVANIIKTALYYIHERVWNISCFGVPDCRRTKRASNRSHGRSRRRN